MDYEFKAYKKRQRGQEQQMDFELKTYHRKRQRRRGQQQTVELPDEIVREVLIWLPVKSLASGHYNKTRELLQHSSIGGTSLPVSLNRCSQWHIAMAYVFNPATRDALALPESNRNMRQRDMCPPIGLGFDASTGKYKVARSFYRSREYNNPMGIAAMGFEVFTINGEESCWRETLVDPPYPVLFSKIVTHCKGCLFYYIDKKNQQNTPQALLRFSLQDETFGVTPLLTDTYPQVEDDEVTITELGGQLCATFLCNHLQRVCIYMSGDVMHPDWNCWHIINVMNGCYPIASLGSGRILLRRGSFVYCANLKSYSIEEEELNFNDIRYLGPNEDNLGHAWEDIWYDILPYTESLVSIIPRATLQAL
uniref:F-box associated beta-propeller type 3 domain-containing protein n=1 Tax=Leersia perrieri TaxID=77586 RepID=A0A0D9WT23_9ORYZ